MDPSPLLEIRDEADIERHLQRVRAAAESMREWIAGQTRDGLALLRRMKFDQVGYHPIDHRPLNLVEQVNQTWTFVVALEATRVLLRSHPEADGFTLAPGAHAAQPLDIMSRTAGQVGAETFAAVAPTNNRKLAIDLGKLAQRSEVHRYVFFMSPKFPHTRRLESMERHGVQVWSLEI
jgi:hypothetical protein